MTFASGIDYKDLMRRASWGVDKSKMTDDDKDEEMGRSYGKALYIEFRQGNNTNQMLFVTEAISPKTKSIVPMTMFARQVSRDHDRRAWRSRAARSKVGAASANNSSVFEEQGAPETANAIAPVLEDFRSYLSAMVTGGWKVFQDPVVVEVSAEDVVKIEEEGTPAALIRRMNRAREAAGFPQELFND